MLRHVDTGLILGLAGIVAATVGPGWRELQETKRRRIDRTREAEKEGRGLLSDAANTLARARALWDFWDWEPRTRSPEWDREMRERIEDINAVSARVSIYFEDSAAVEEALGRASVALSHLVQFADRPTETGIKMREGWAQTLAGTATDFTHAARELMGKEGSGQALAFRADDPAKPWELSAVRVDRAHEQLPTGEG
jgi:hypothetical protein